MSRKFKLAFLITVILLVSMFTIAAARGWGSPLAQTGMDMPTETMQPQSTANLATPLMQDTPTPLGKNTQQGMPSPSMTSIFTGFTPYPNSTYMGGSGMMGGGMMGGYAGMSGVITDTMGMYGMGTGSMNMGSCSMMSGMDMSSGTSMSGMDMSSGYSISGMDMSGMSAYVVDDSSSVFSDPWLLIGWVLLGLLVIAILVAAALGIVWIFRRSRQIRPT
ncbi:MAG: hypothetical protein A2030_08875 [Chloroflexi bacterium RBG_19FT_COMBO_50_10]|nr:MAG: hypothetical protein A2030_08875 [Chloroflexi bacterium RBG_19FT_COMBO_50_10]